MSDENVGGLPELPEPAMHERNPYLGLAVDPYEGLRALKWYSAEQMHAYARAALSAHGKPVVDGERIKAALDIASRYASVDGAHHKDWVIDQMVRALTGDDYNRFVTNAKHGDDGPDIYEWNEGIAP